MRVRLSWVLALLGTALLAGCASSPGSHDLAQREYQAITATIPGYAAPKIDANGIDPRIWEQWGFLAKLAGKSFAIKADYTGTSVLREFSWKDYGKVLEVRTAPVGWNQRGVPSYIVFNVAHNRLEHRGEWGYFQPDGSLLWYAEGLGNLSSLWWLTEQGIHQAVAKSGMTVVYHYYDPTMEGEFLASNRQVKESRDRASREFWSNTAGAVAAGTVALSQAYSEATADQARADAQTRALQNEIARNAQQRTAATQQQAPANAVQRPMPVHRPSNGRSDSPSANSASGWQAASAPDRQAEATRVVSKSETGAQASRRTYLEAVTVCTKPSGPKQSFECKTPLNIVTGHKDDISGRRTPEEIANNETCTDPRALPSSTHFVWGCGFAATGAINAQDRGAGVDIRGRRTYYCSEEQTSCRRTEP